MPRGGARRGAGRPSGVKNSLPYGMVRALAAEDKANRALVRGVRMPKDLPPEHQEVADEAFNAYVRVMRGEVHSSIAPSVIKAAHEIRDEINGPIVQKHEVKGSFSSIVEASLEDAKPELPEKASE